MLNNGNLIRRPHPAANISLYYSRHLCGKPPQELYPANTAWAQLWAAGASAIMGRYEHTPATREPTYSLRETGRYRRCLALHPGPAGAARALPRRPDRL